MKIGSHEFRCSPVRIQSICLWAFWIMLASSSPATADRPEFDHHPGPVKPGFVNPPEEFSKHGSLDTELVAEKKEMTVARAQSPHPGL